MTSLIHWHPYLICKRFDCALIALFENFSLLVKRFFQFKFEESNSIQRKRYIFLIKTIANLRLPIAICKRTLFAISRKANNKTVAKRRKTHQSEQITPIFNTKSIIILLLLPKLFFNFASD